MRLYGTISSDLHALEKVMGRLGGPDVRLHVVYEAGPTGYVIHRRLAQLKIDCIVVAPSRTPRPKGQRQKTDRRDALRLARLHRAGELTGIHVPDAVDEAIRDLTRARADAVHDLTRAKQRLKSLLLRQGYRYKGKANWSAAHQRYLRELVLPLPALKSVLVAELGDVRRFDHPRHLMAFLGLIPSEHSSGESRKLGGITKSGNAHARWILAEVVQHALHPPKVSSQLSVRQQGKPQAYRELAWKAQTRLHKRGWHLLQRGVIKPKVTIALAREMSGFVWALLREVPVKPA